MASRPCITIVGTGLIGTSIGMAIQQARGPEILVLGHDKDFAQARLAQRMGGVHKVERNLRTACAQADMIVIAIPAGEVRETLSVIAHDLKSGCVITDTTSVKAPVIAWADEYLSDEVSFVGGDPILLYSIHKSDSFYCFCQAFRVMQSYPSFFSTLTKLKRHCGDRRGTKTSPDFCGS